MLTMLGLLALSLLVLGDMLNAGPVRAGRLSANSATCRPASSSSAQAVRVMDRLAIEQEVAAAHGAVVASTRSTAALLTECPVIVGDVLVYRDRRPHHGHRGGPGSTRPPGGHRAAGLQGAEQAASLPTRCGCGWAKEHRRRGPRLQAELGQHGLGAGDGDSDARGVVPLQLRRDREAEPLKKGEGRPGLLGTRQRFCPASLKTSRSSPSRRVASTRGAARLARAPAGQLDEALQIRKAGRPATGRWPAPGAPWPAWESRRPAVICSSAMPQAPNGRSSSGRPRPGAARARARVGPRAGATSIGDPVTVLARSAGAAVAAR